MSQLRGRPFAPGNKLGRGRPRGSRNKTTLAVEEMFGEHAEALVKKCIVMAMQGDTVAMRLCIERLMAPPKQSPVKFKLPPVTTMAELAQAQITVLETVSRGQLTPAEAETIGTLFENRRRMMETEDLAARLEALEQRDREERSN
jgi:Family of unknown function (DUF5681)